MPLPDQFNRKLRKITPDRDWNQVRDMWLGYSDAASAPGECPGQELVELYGISVHLDEMPRVRSHPKNIAEDIQGLRSSILKTAFFHLQKAAYTFHAAYTECDSQFRCWSISSAYHASLFAAKSVIAFLGVVTISVPSRSRHYFVDTFSERITGQRTSFGHERHTRILDSECSIDHKEMWGLLQAILRKTRFVDSILSPQTRQSLTDIEPKDFGLMRHGIHYRDTVWPFDDLRASQLDRFFDNCGEVTQLAEILQDPGSAKFPVGLAATMLRLGMNLLGDLAEKSALFEMEYQIVRCHLSPGLFEPGVVG